ncbi:MAG: hypothetical protein SFU27_14605 [Thermonemataceae bacterium]|nr:hypothetical protein [Thermonemataceae bacterium]
MKKNKFSIFIFVLFLASFVACKKSDDPAPIISGKYEKGVLVINEGNFSEGNGSLSFLFPNDSLANGIFENENGGLKIGGTIQSVNSYLSGTNKKLAVVTNRKDQVILADADSLNFMAVVYPEADKRLDNPVSFAAIGEKGFVSNWGDINQAFGNYPKGFLTEINLKNNTFSRKIALDGVRPQDVIAANNKLYVTVSNGSDIYVYDSNGNFLKNIPVEQSPDKMLIDKNGKIWVICNNEPDYVNFTDNEGTLLRINPETDAVEQSIPNVPCGSYNSKIAYYNDKIYSLRDKKVFVIDTTNSSVNELISNDFSLYGIGVNPNNGDLYLGEYIFASSSRVRQLSKEGDLIREYLVGIGTNGFLFF